VRNLLPNSPPPAETWRAGGGAGDGANAEALPAHASARTSAATNRISTQPMIRKDAGNGPGRQGQGDKATSPHTKQRGFCLGGLRWLLN